EDPKRCRGDHDRDADQRKEVAGGEGDPPSTAGREACERDRERRRTQRDGCRGQTRERVVAGEVRRQQRAERDRRTEGDATEHLPEREHRDGAPLDRGQLLDGRSAHEPVTASRTGLRSVPIPVTSTSMTSPATTGPTPAGVPVMITSPGSKVNASEA